MSNDSRRPIATIKFEKQAAKFTSSSLNVLDSLTNKPISPSPNPSLDVFEADIKALQDAQNKALSGLPGAAKVRDARLKKVKKDLVKLVESVQLAADAQPTVEEAAALIINAGMSLKVTATRTKPPFAVKQLPVSGSVQLDARSVAKRAVYFWEMSTDNATWAEAGKTLRARHVITGLTPGKTYYFRFRALTAGGLSDASQVLSLIVV